MSDVNKARSIRVLQEAFGEGRLEVLDECVASDVVDHAALPGMPAGREGLKATVQLVRSAFTDLNFTVVHAIAEGQHVAVRWEASATHSGPFMNIPASGKRIRLTGIELDRHEGNVISEIWEERDMLGLLVQIGAVDLPS